MINGAKLLGTLTIGFIARICKMEFGFRRTKMQLFLDIEQPPRKDAFASYVEQSWLLRDDNPLKRCIVQCSVMD
jgi:hypothetical protein